MTYDDINCTKCNYKVRDLWKHQMEDGETLEFVCVNCEHVFNVHCEIVTSYAVIEKKAKKG